MKFKTIFLLSLLALCLLVTIVIANFAYLPNSSEYTTAFIEEVSAGDFEFEQDSQIDENIESIESTGGDFTFEQEPEIDENFEPGERVLTRVEDDALLLSDEEKAALRQKLDRISEETGVDVIVHTNYSLGGKTPRDYADDYFDYNGYGLGPNYDGIIFVLSMEYRDWRISTHGFGVQAFTDRGQQIIVDQMLPYLSDGEYYEAFDKFADLSEEYILQAKSGEAYDVNNMPTNKLSLTNILTFLGVGSVAGAIAGGTYTQILSSTHKTLSRQRFAGGYKSGDINFNNKVDRFITRNVTRTRIPKTNRNSSGGGGFGGSSTHRSSSGRSHGGSGGKF